MDKKIVTDGSQQAKSPKNTRREPGRFGVLIWVLLVIAVIVVVGLVIGAIGFTVPQDMKDRALAKVEARMHGQATLETAHITFFPNIRVVGTGLVFRRLDQTDLPPLVKIQGFEAETSYFSALRHPHHIGHVKLTGLDIHTPPRHGEPGQTKAHTGNDQEQKPPVAVVDLLTTDNARLTTLPKDPNKVPLEWDIYHLEMRDVTTDRSASFTAKLSNPKPEGFIDVTGKFGPWDTGDPSLTPVSGKYTFAHADLGTLKGIGGILESNGQFTGVLDHLDVSGETTTPNFKVDIAGHAVPLNTQYTAVVNGTDGNTYLQPVLASFLRSSLTANGEVVGTPGIKGKHIILDVVMTKGRIEDLLQLAVRANKPMMTGAVELRTKFDLPPGEEDVMDKLKLDGEFGVQAAKFSSSTVQEKVNKLSKRAQGEPKAEDDETAVSNLRGRFKLANAVITFSTLTFNVTGASITLDGTYNLKSEALDFHGTARLEAPVSKLVTGVKSFFLKPFDPLFRRKGAGTVLPIKITGTREKPSFGLSIGGH